MRVVNQAGRPHQFRFDVTAGMSSRTAALSSDTHVEASYRQRMTPREAAPITLIEPSNTSAVNRIGASPSQRLRRRLGLGAVGITLALALAGCGSSGDSDSTNAPEERNESKKSTATQGKPGALTGTGKGTIEIGDTKHELKITRCTSLFGAISGEGESASEPDNVSVRFEFTPDDWSDSKSIELMGHPGMIEMRVEDPYLHWMTGSLMLDDLTLPDGVAPSDAKVTERHVTEDGQTMEGKATFVEVNQNVETSNPDTGSFNFSCPPAG